MNNSAKPRDPIPSRSAVLVVDDHEMVRRLVVRMLESAGLRVIAVGNGLDAIELVRRRPREFGCILQDLSMPQMRGEEVIRRMHEIEPSLPIVAFSAEDEFTAGERLSGLNVAGYLQKPFDIDAMIEVVTRLSETTLA